MVKRIGYRIVYRIGKVQERGCRQDPEPPSEEEEEKALQSGLPYPPPPPRRS